MANRVIALVTASLMVAGTVGLIAEAGLRLMGFSPPPMIHLFHEKLGWVKAPGIEASRSTPEFEVTYRINQLGPRTDADRGYEKRAGTKRIVVLGDSFTFGYGVERDDLFVDILERRLRGCGHAVECLNGGTEGYSTDQELLWLREEGLRYSPDLVLLAAYQNDIFWNGQDHYLRFPKPLFAPDGDADEPVNLPLEDPGTRPWWARWTALGSLVHKLTGATSPLFTPEGGRPIPMEWGVLLVDAPAFVTDAWRRTEACLRGLKETCRRSGLPLALALIPDKAQVHESARAVLARALALPAARWDADLPTRRLLEMAGALDIDVIDPLDALRASSSEGLLYYRRDWHFNPSGNRVFAETLFQALMEEPAWLGRAVTAPSPGPEVAPRDESRSALRPGWVLVVAALWVLLGACYALTYRQEKITLVFVKIGALLASIIAIVLLLRFLVSLLPLALARFAGILFLGLLLGFVGWKLRHDLSSMGELFTGFVVRGHWYVLPLLAAMLTIGSLLVVAASSPLVAPFIYTLF